jgi:heptosyltransferase-2
MKLGIFLPNWVGDVAMSTPTLRALRHHFGPESRLVGIMRPYTAEVLAGTPWLDAQLLYDPKSKDRSHGSWALVRSLREEKLDTIVLLTNSLRTGALAWLAGAKERIGYARNGRGPLLTRKLYPPKQNRRFIPSPVLDYYLDLAYALGCPSESPKLELATLPEDEARADKVWSRLGLSSGQGVVAINSGGAFGAAKLWPSGHFAALARRIAVEHGRAVLVLCGPSERTIAQEIVRGAAHPRVVSLADFELSIGLSKACVRRSSLLVTTDSGPRHFAAAFDVPVITLFGPTHIEWSENHYQRATHLRLDLECSPCQQRTCPLGHHRCMRDLSVDQVYRAVAEQLQPGRQHRAA